MKSSITIQRGERMANWVITVSDYAQPMGEQIVHSFVLKSDKYPSLSFSVTPSQ